MEFSDVMKLIGAGYTKEEIQAMDTPPKQEPPKEEPKQEAKQEPPKEEPKQEQKQEQAPSADLALMVQTLTATVSGLQDTVKALQSANVDKAKVDKPTGAGLDDIMKSFIDQF